MQACSSNRQKQAVAHPDSPSGEMGFWNIVEVGVVRKWSASKPLDEDVGSNGSCSCPGDPSPPLSGFAELFVGCVCVFVCVCLCVCVCVRSKLGSPSEYAGLENNLPRTQSRIRDGRLRQYVPVRKASPNC